MAMKQIVGQETRRSLRVGESLRPQDFRHPILITKGAIVTMTYDVPGVTLTASMRAIGAGGLGETITVQNPISYRQVGAIVTGPGQVQALNSEGIDMPTTTASVNP
jgi:flagellar basal body P-ring formation protein FlgA